jgi:hypothetical protein
MAKLNCWEVKKCGRQPGGENVSAMGICPAATNVKLDGVHYGKKAGRACWVVAGTLCDGQVQGTFAIKYHDCSRCDFYLNVKEEEEAAKDFQPTTALIRIMAF